MISGWGPENPEIMLISDFATPEDVNSGYAISGKAESLFVGIFKECGYHFKQVYRTCLVKEKLDYYGRSKKKLGEAIKKVEINNNSFSDLLRQEIIEIVPNIIIPTGENVFNNITGLSAIKKRRGSILNLREEIQSKITSKFIRVIPTFSSEDIWRNWTLRAITTCDIHKAVLLRYRIDPIIDNFVIQICKSGEQLREFIERFIKTAERLHFDIETQFGIPTCISFCFNGQEAISVPLFGSDIDEANQALIFILVARLLASPIPKINQAIKYDITNMERFGFRINNIAGDTILATSLIYPELPKGLDFLTSIYTDIPYYKDEGREYNSNLHSKNRLYIYNAKDSLSNHIIYTKQLEELEELELKQFYEDFVPLIRIYERMDNTGILVDPDIRETLIAKYKSLLLIHEMMIQQVTGISINYRSPVQVGKLIYEEMKFPIRRKTSPLGNIGYNTEEETLEELYIFHAEDNKYGANGALALKEIITCRKISKLLEYLTIPLSPDGRFHSTSKLHGTETGRTSGGKYNLDIIFMEDEYVKVGGTFQNLPKHGFKIGEEIYGKDLRTMFIPTPGWIFIEGDLSQAEARVDAVLAEDFELLQKFDIPPGIHCLTASWIYGCDPFEIKKGTQEYHLGKTARHAGERNMQANTLAMLAYKNHIEITSKEAELILNRFHEFSPRIRSVFHNGIRDFIRKNRYLVSPHGRRRTFFARMDEHLYNEAISTIPQATVTDQVKFAMIRIMNRLDANKFRFLTENHDSVLAEVLPEYANEYIKVYQEEMTKPISFNKCSLLRDFDLVIPVEIKSTEKSWGDL